MAGERPDIHVCRLLDRCFDLAPAARRGANLPSCSFEAGLLDQPLVWALAIPSLNAMSMPTMLSPNDVSSAVQAANAHGGKCIWIDGQARCSMYRRVAYLNLCCAMMDYATNLTFVWAGHMLEASGPRLRRCGSQFLASS
jgi:hypothetical protein